MEVTLNVDSFGRVVGTIEHHGAHATVTSSNAATAMTELQLAVDAAVIDGLGECFWPEATGEYRWLFRREGSIIRVAILWSIGTLTGWEHRFWAECDAREFGSVMRGAIAACDALELKG